MKNIQFESAQDMRIKHPETFAAPSYEELKEIKEGDHVKVCTGQERFWCLISKIDEDNKVHAVVDNDLINTNLHGLKLGDKVSFLKENIYDIDKKQ